MRESLNSSFSLLSGGFIYYSSFPRQQGSSPKDLAQDLPLALPPLFHSESVQKFLPLFLWDFQRLGNPRTRRGTRRDVDVALSVRKGCCPPLGISWPSRRSHREWWDIPHSHCWLWSREIGRSQLLWACCVLDATYSISSQLTGEEPWGSAVLRNFTKGSPAADGQS